MSSTNFIQFQTPINADWLNDVNRKTYLENVSVKDFGAVGDGVTNDTAAIQAALISVQASKKTLYFPTGTYLTDTLQLPLTAINEISIEGESPNNTIIQKKSSDGLNLFVIGSPSSTFYTANFYARNLTFKGIAGNTAASVVAYDLVRSVFSSCHFKNSLIGYNSLGGISNTFETCLFAENSIGINFNNFTSLAGGGYPNNNELRNCIIVDNTIQGVKFNNGRNLTLSGCDIEGNGTTGNSSTMGVYVDNVNSESGGLGPAIGVTINNCWIEANAGDAALQFNSGVNTVRSSYIAANANATYDIHITGGNYHLSEVAFGTNKPHNVQEDAGSLTGNSIINSFDALLGTFTTIPSKTIIQGLYNSGSGNLIHTFQMRSGSVPVVMSQANPMLQMGTATTGAGGVVSVTFPTSYASGPVVTASIGDNTATAVDSIQIYNVTASGFTARATQVLNGSSVVNTLVGYGINWIAMGPTP